MADDLNPTGAARHRVAAMLGVAAAVLVIGVPVALAGRFGPDQPAAAAQPAALPSAADESAADESNADESAAGPSAADESAAAGERILPPVPSLPAGAEPLAATQAAGTMPVIKGMPDEDGCPVDAGLLLTALRTSDLPAKLAGTDDLADVQCYATYAVARTDPDTARPATVVFRYTEMTGSWRAVSGGASRSCDGVPEAVRPHFRRCAASR